MYSSRDVRQEWTLLCQMPFVPVKCLLVLTVIFAKLVCALLPVSVAVWSLQCKSVADFWVYLYFLCSALSAELKSVNKMSEHPENKSYTLVVCIPLIVTLQLYSGDLVEKVIVEMLCFGAVMCDSL